MPLQKLGGNLVLRTSAETQGRDGFLAWRSWHRGHSGHSIGDDALRSSLNSSTMAESQCLSLIGVHIHRFLNKFKKILFSSKHRYCSTGHMELPKCKAYFSCLYFPLRLETLEYRVIFSGARPQLFVPIDCHTIFSRQQNATYHTNASRAAKKSKSRDRLGINGSP